MNLSILQGDVVERLREIPDKSVQCVVTSPPYYGLRNYQVEGQIGLEKTPEEYVQKMVEVFREVWRVLRDDGTLWLNMGDSYANNSGGFSGSENSITKAATIRKRDTLKNLKGTGLKPKDMIGIPWRVAFALQADGWYLRSDIIWSKPNPMPESVTDRPTKSHEYIFLLTKNARYFYDADAIREQSQPSTLERGKYGWNGKMVFNEDGKEEYRSQPDPVDKMGERWCAANRNARTVWTITTQARPEAHFATFPDEIPRRCIKAGTSEYGCCPECGTPWERVIEATGGVLGKSWHPHEDDSVTGQVGFKDDGSYRREFKGWQSTCKCGREDTVPCVVLDPFGGSGTTGEMARELKRDCILIELNPEYIKIMKNRLRLNEQLGV